MPLSQLAAMLDAQLRGDGGCTIHGIAALDRAGAAELSFCDSIRTQEALERTNAGAVLITEQLVPLCRVNCLIVSDVRLAYAKASQYFAPPMPQLGVATSATIDPSAQLATDVQIGPHCHIAANAHIGARTVLESGAVIGCDSRIGADCHIGPHAVISHGCQLGERSSVGSGSVIGGDGFGFAWAGEEQRWEKIAQLGRVIIGDDVVIGTLNTIDRGALNDTIIGNDVKTDSQVHIAHGVEVGAHCAFAGHVVVAGSSHFGPGCMIGGRSAINGHLTIGAGASITGCSNVMRDVPPGAKISSVLPAMGATKWWRSVALWERLPELFRRMHALERRAEAD